MFKKILVAVDLDHDAQNENLLRVATEVANSNSADIFLLNVISAAQPVVSQFLPESYEKMASENIQAQLSTIANKLDIPNDSINITVRFGDAYHEILAYAKKKEVDLIIVASHKPHVSDFLLGTTAARIVRHAECSTLVVRQQNKVVT